MPGQRVVGLVGALRERHSTPPAQSPPTQGLHAFITSCIPTWDGHMPDQDRVEETGHRQQHVGQELLEAAQPVGLLPCSVGQGPWLTPGGGSPG
jgi:hypothetical protein